MNYLALLVQDEGGVDLLGGFLSLVCVFWFVGIALTVFWLWALIDGMRKGDPDSAELNFLSGACWLNLEEPEKSIPYLEKATGADSHLLPAHAALGQALLETGRAKDAIPHLQAALPIDEDGSRRFQLFRAYAIAGQGESARQALSDYKEFTKRLRLANP